MYEKQRRIKLPRFIRTQADFIESKSGEYVYNVAQAGNLYFYWLYLGSCVGQVAAMAGLTPSTKNIVDSSQNDNSKNPTGIPQYLQKITYMIFANGSKHKL